MSEQYFKGSTVPYSNLFLIGLTFKGCVRGGRL